MRWVWIVLALALLLCTACAGQPVISQGTYCQGVSMDRAEGCHEDTPQRVFWFVGESCPDPLIRPSRIGVPVNVWYMIPWSCETTVVSYHPL